MIAYTDGACSGNPGPGGWAWIIVDEESNKIIATDYDGESDTTNNRMELMALYSLLFYLSNNKVDQTKIKSIEVRTDSNYLFNTITKGWLKRWVVTKEVSRPNYELWVEVYKLLNIIDVTMTKVKGHSGEVYNDMVDNLAVKALNHYRLVKGGA